MPTSLSATSKTTAASKSSVGVNKKRKAETDSKLECDSDNMASVMASLGALCAAQEATQKKLDGMCQKFTRVSGELDMISVLVATGEDAKEIKNSIKEMGQELSREKTEAGKENEKANSEPLARLEKKVDALIANMKVLFQWLEENKGQ